MKGIFEILLMDNSSGENKPVKTYEFPMVPEVGDTLTLSDKEIFIPELRILPTQITAKEVGSDKIFYKAVLVGKVVQVTSTKVKPMVGQTYWVQGVIGLPVKVEILQVNEDKNQVRIEQGWVSIEKLYHTEEDCPTR